MNGLKVKVSDSLDNVPNENVVTTGDRQTNQQSDQLLELLEWLFATKNLLPSENVLRKGRVSWSSNKNIKGSKDSYFDGVCE